MAGSSPASCDPSILYRGPAGLPALRNRNDLGKLCEVRGFTDGIEIGVQKGDNTRTILTQWPSCKSFKLVDLWQQQENYKDFANVDNNKQEALFEKTKQNLKTWENKTEYFRMYSTEAAKKIDDHSADFVYVDARHDYCGAMEDMQAYWPKIRPGGIMAGHDFLNNAEMQRITSWQDWSLCMDGTVNLGSVKGAVEDFAAEQGVTITVMYAEGAKFASWMIQKPTRPECVDPSSLGNFTLQSFSSQPPPAST
ncbi:MAG: hypothetical protein SGILL_009937 [Bacillariaceae sp.]